MPGKGFNHTPASGQFKNYSSWGRTRRPKALVSDAKLPANAVKQTPTSVVTVAVGDLKNDIDSDIAGQNGYVTENQMFLHLQIEDNGGGETVTLYAYNYAFGSWSPLYLPLSFDRGDAQAINKVDNADGAGDVLQASVSAGTVNDAYAIASFTSIDGQYMVTVPICGIDRIAFVDDGDHNENFIVRAACSTF